MRDSNLITFFLPIKKNVFFFPALSAHFSCSKKKRTKPLHLQTKNFLAFMLAVDCHKSWRKLTNPSLAVYENLHCVVNSLFTARHCPLTG